MSLASVRCRSSSSSITKYTSRKVEPKIIKFYADIHTKIVYSHTGYDVTCYSRTAVITKRLGRGGSDVVDTSLIAFQSYSSHGFSMTTTFELTFSKPLQLLEKSGILSTSWSVVVKLKAKAYIAVLD